MPKSKKRETEDPLVRLLSVAQQDALAGLVRELAGKEPEIRRNCFEYLKKHVALQTRGMEPL
jgi:hypothetical protein